MIPSTELAKSNGRLGQRMRERESRESMLSARLDDDDDNDDDCYRIIMK